MIFYAITDNKLSKGKSLFVQIRKYVSLGADWIQIREKDLPDKELLEIAEKTKKMVKGKKIKTFVNNRADIAHLAQFDGVHLSSDSIPIKEIKNKFKKLIIIKSCHTIDEIEKAEKEGADFTTLSPIFETPKKFFLKPLGLKILKEAANSFKIPIIALGGINEQNILDVAKAGPFGIGAIRFFNEIDRSKLNKIKKLLNERN